MIAARLIGASGAFALSVLTAYLAAATCATLAVVISLRGLAVPVNTQDALGMIAHDWRGMAGMFLPVIAAGFAIALTVAALIGRRWPHWRRALFVVAGAAALVTVHLALQAAFDITPIAVARSLPGLASQAAAGAAGGCVFAALSRRWC